MADAHFNVAFSRRAFLRRLTVLGTAALLPLLGEQAEAAEAKFISVGKAADFKPGVYHAVTMPNGLAIQIRRLPGKTLQFQAFSAHCTHKGCLVSWIPADKQFHCPCHGGRFDANGKNIAGPPPTPLPALPTKVVKGIVLVAVYPPPSGGKLSASLGGK